MHVRVCTHTCTSKPPSDRGRLPRFPALVHPGLSTSLRFTVADRASPARLPCVFSENRTWAFGSFRCFAITNHPSRRMVGTPVRTERRAAPRPPWERACWLWAEATLKEMSVLAGIGFRLRGLGCPPEGRCCSWHPPSAARLPPPPPPSPPSWPPQQHLVVLASLTLAGWGSAAY